MENEGLMAPGDHAAHLKQELLSTDSVGASAVSAHSSLVCIADSQQERLFYTPEDRFQMAYISFVLVCLTLPSLSGAIGPEWLLLLASRWARACCSLGTPC